MQGEGFVDYSNRSATPSRREDPTYDEKDLGEVKSKRRKSQVQRDYQDYNRADLEKEARVNHDEPVGNFVGDRHVKGTNDHDGGYVGGAQNPFGGRPQRSYPDEEGDIGRAQSTREDGEQDGYYAAPPSRSQRGFAGPARPFQDRRDQGVDTELYSGRGEQYLGYDPNDRHFLNDHTVPNYPTPTFVGRCFLEGFQIGSFLTTLLGFNLLVVMAIATHVTHTLNPFHKEPPMAKVEKDWEERISGERFSSRAEYYANYWGYQCEDIDVETEDGFVLRLHHLTSKKHKILGHPVILQHGILSNSVTFMVNEERSLAFWLLEQGYDVYVTNIRTNFEMPHRHFKRSDPRYWAWAVKEIGIYDLPAIIDYVHRRTSLKPAYIGHSQGTGTMFLALSRGMRPDIGNKMSSFIALGPAVYGGPVLRSFPFSLMRKFRPRWLWSLVFGVREFIPVISLLQRTLPSWLFGHTAFPVFAFIFGFHRHNWLRRQIPKYFRTVAVANPSELLYYYMNVLSYDNCIFDTEIQEPWFPPSFPPLAIFYGTLDTLVLGRPLVERIQSYEPHVRLLNVTALENYEHLDMIWGVNAVPECFLGIKDTIEKTKDGYAPAQTVRPRGGSGSGRRSRNR